MADPVVGGAPDPAPRPPDHRAGASRGGPPGASPHGATERSGPAFAGLAILFGSGLLAEPSPLPIIPLLELSLVGSTAVGASIEVDVADGPVVLGSVGTVGAVGDAIAPSVAPLVVRGHPLGRVLVHTGADAADGAEAALETATQLALLIAELIEHLPAWGLEHDDPVATFVVDKRSRISSATPSMAGIFGYPLAVLDGFAAITLLHPDDREIASVAFNRARTRQGRRMPREWRVVHADGSTLTVQMRADSRLDDPAVQGIVYTVRATAARSTMDRILSAQMRVLEDIARGVPLAPILDRIVALLDDVTDGHGLLFTAGEAPPPIPEPRHGGRVARVVPLAADVLRLHGSPSLPPALARRLAEPQDIAEDAPPWGRATKRGESVIDELLSGPGWTGWRDELLTLGINAAYAFPFRPDHRDRLGVAAVLARRSGPPTDEDGHVLKVAAGLARVAIERDLAAADLVRRATRDELTGLANRAHLVDLLERVAASPGPARALAVVFLDLDRFTLINDTYGHEVGDELLQSVGARLWATAPPGAVLARFSGDEFVALLTDLDDPHTALATADRFAQAMQAPFVLGGAELRATVSMGVAFVRLGAGTTSAATILRDADSALARAKARGRDRVEVFDDVLRHEVHLRLQLEQDLRVGLDAEQLVVHYQPEIDLTTDEVVGVEALVRWQHPERGLLLPGEFIELAEETGLVIALGEQVLDHASEHASRWQHRVAEGHPPFTVWVNAAMRQLDPATRHPRRLVDTIAALLERHQLPPRMLGVEITERDLVRDIDDTVAQLEALADLGVRLAVDDFGTGYASLTYLKRLPVEVVKIDQSFVAGLGTDTDDEAIVGAVIQLAGALGKQVVAEGVETEEQRDRLLALGCRVAQGYLMARPAAAEDLGL